MTRLLNTSRVIKITENRLIPTPNARVRANPFTIVSPKVEPNQKRIMLVIKLLNLSLGLMAKHVSNLDQSLGLQNGLFLIPL